MKYCGCPYSAVLLLWLENYIKERCINLKVKLNETTVMLEIMKRHKSIFGISINLVPKLAFSNQCNYL